MLRTLPPSVMLSFAAQFDETALNTAVEILDLADARANNEPAHKLAMEQLYIPIAEGGIELRRTVDTCHVAFLSAHISAIRDQPEIVEDKRRTCRFIRGSIKSYYGMRKQGTQQHSQIDDSAEDVAFSEKQRKKIDRLLIPGRRTTRAIPAK
jgi:hypothetical protein